jgi:hypothetical protein
MTPSLVRPSLAVQLRRRVLPDEQAIIPFFRWVMRHRDGHSVWDRPDYSDDRKGLIMRNASAAFADIANGDGSHIDTERVRGISAPVTLVVGEHSQPWFHRITQTLEALLPEAERIENPRRRTRDDIREPGSRRQRRPHRVPPHP